MKFGFGKKCKSSISIRLSLEGSKFGNFRLDTTLIVVLSADKNLWERWIRGAKIKSQGGKLCRTKKGNEMFQPQEEERHNFLELFALSVKDTKTTVSVFCNATICKIGFCNATILSYKSFMSHRILKISSPLTDSKYWCNVGFDNFFFLQIWETIFEFCPKIQMFLLDKTQY